MLMNEASLTSVVAPVASSNEGAEDCDPEFLYFDLWVEMLSMRSIALYNLLGINDSGDPAISLHVLYVEVNFVFRAEMLDMMLSL